MAALIPLFMFHDIKNFAKYASRRWKCRKAAEVSSYSVVRPDTSPTDLYSIYDRPIWLLPNYFILFLFITVGHVAVQPHHSILVLLSYGPEMQSIQFLKVLYWG
jgi:hypothetical protein